VPELSDSKQSPLDSIASEIHHFRTRVGGIVQKGFRRADSGEALTKKARP